MQTHSLRIKSYRSWAVNDTATPEAIERLRKLELYDKLQQEVCSQATCLEAIDWSKSTYYRWRHRYRLVGTEGVMFSISHPSLSASTSMDSPTRATSASPKTTLPTVGAT